MWLYEEKSDCLENFVPKPNKKTRFTYGEEDLSLPLNSSLWKKRK
jgi:hypothetical protein